MKVIIKSLAILLMLTFLAANYSGSASAAADFNVKVKLNNKLGPASTYHFVPRGSSFIKEAPAVSLSSEKKYTVVVSSGKLSVKDASKVLASGLTTVSVEPAGYAKENNVHLFKGALAEAHPYMGTILFRLSGTTSIQPVNILLFEDYLKGVVPSEMPASWGSPTSGGMEALKTQAIAARSYVFSKMNQSTLEIDDTTTYQVYNGFIWDPLSPKYLSDYRYSNQAVAETQGQILTYIKNTGQKGFVTAYFSSSNGGQTELPEQYWGGKLPYITETKVDKYDTSNVKWQLSWMKQQLPGTIDLMNPSSWWGTVAENNLNSSIVSNLQSRNSFQIYKNYVLKRAQAIDPTVESIKIASVDSIVPVNHENTGKVKEIKVDIAYYTRNKVNTALKYDMAPGAASKTLFGTDRYSTSAAIAAEYVGASKAEAIVLGRGDVPADALAGTVLAHKMKAPLLLIRNDSLPPSVEKFLSEKTAAGAPVYLLGGEGAISKEIEDLLRFKGFQVTRLSGKDRTGTSLAIAKEIGATSKVMIATGDDESSDALSASAYAANKGIPIIIQRGEKLAEQTRAYLSGSIGEAIIIGGAGAVSSTVEGELKLMNIATNRISGQTRVETSIAINEQLPLAGENVVIGNGYAFIDALAGSVLAAKNGSPIVMLHPEAKNLPSEFLDAMPVKKLAFFLGGSSILSEELKNGINQYIGSSLEQHQLSVTFKGIDPKISTPTITFFRETLGGANLKSLDFQVVNQPDRLVFDGSGFGHGIGLSQWGSYKRAISGFTAKEILQFYYQGVSIDHTSSFVQY